jgi:hypothetical protein
MYDIMMNEQLIQSRDAKVDSSKALDASLVVTECSRTKSYMHDTSNSSMIHITLGVDADIRPVNDQVPFAEVHLTVQHNVPASERQHTDQSEPIYDTYLLEKVDSNTTPDSTNMSHKEGEIEQDVEHDRVKCSLLKAEFFKTNNMVKKEIYDELSNKFLQLEKHCISLEKHCISLEISIQQKEESLQTIKPCKNLEFPEFREFFEINNLKDQLQAKNSTINNLKTRINMHEKSNYAKIKHEIDAMKTRNIELECNVAKLLMENETLKKHYKDLYDSIKEKRIKTIEQTTSLMAKNDVFKAQLQEKGFAIAALKNELRKLTGISVNTKFAKPSILGKSLSQPLRKQSVVRQPTAFRSERPKFSKLRFAFQVDEIQVLSKPVTSQSRPNEKECVVAKPHHMSASSASRNNPKRVSFVTPKEHVRHKNSVQNHNL